MPHFKLNLFINLQTFGIFYGYDNREDFVGNMYPARGANFQLRYVRELYRAILIFYMCTNSYH